MKDTAIQVANLMAASARTAPKAGGKDFLEIAVISQEADLQRIAQAMRDYAPKSSNEAYWLRDADNIAKCQALVLVGLSGSPTAGYDCGACGHATCKDFAQTRTTSETPMGYSGPHCVMRMMDIGCALASAAKTASLLNLDNRVQQRVGAAARALGFIEASVVMGIPVGFHGKSIYFDRSAPKH
ncbi:ferredoxin domain-containing protein [Fundidesulfovibrio soli]|uniref:ferredoxin domain-containing protein n=1 Tax=Fundidesulfovibrio soli TaxID=2922716 RepID=UPI001FAF05A2|nr:DUF2148 domain-containing protein [Fundidesulfovibrio soli]